MTSPLETQPLDAVQDGTSEQRRKKRLRHRREALTWLASNIVFDGFLLLLYAAAGVIPFALGLTFTLAGLLTISPFVVISETGLSDRFEDHYLALPMTAFNSIVMIAFLFYAPEVAIVFIGAIFLIFIYASLKLKIREAVFGLIILFAGLASFFLLTENQISVPQATFPERLVTLVTIMTILIRVSFVGVFSNSLRASLYRRGVELQGAYRRIKELAELDELTGAFNRRHIMAALDEEIKRSARGSGPCSIALIDLDWFKRINDEHGHPTGDEVLRTFAISVFANIRSIDKFARYGGEEFLILLPETSGEAATQTIDRLREIVASLDWTALAPNMRVTISAGITTLTTNDDAEHALMRADHALYRAKREGRNRVCNSTPISKPSGHQNAARVLESSGHM